MGCVISYLVAVCIAEEGKRTGKAKMNSGANMSYLPVKFESGVEALWGLWAEWTSRYHAAVCTKSEAEESKKA